MEWVILSQDESTGRVDETRYTTEEGFRAALEEMFCDIHKRFTSARLPDGRVLDESEARALVGGPFGSSWG